MRQTQHFENTAHAAAFIRDLVANIVSDLGEIRMALGEVAPELVAEAEKSWMRMVEAAMVKAEGTIGKLEGKARALGETWPTE